MTVIREHITNCGGVELFQTDMDVKLESDSSVMELERIATFSSWPHYAVQSGPSPLKMARLGFVYSGRGSQVICPLCKLELDGLELGVNLEEEHSSKSPNCRLASRGEASVQVPTLHVEMSPETPADKRALVGVLKAAQCRSENHMRSSELTQVAPATVVRQIDRSNPDFELLKRERFRLETFFDWPSMAKVKPAALAREGFYYTGTVDRVRCVYCRGSLHSWLPTDDPVVEHSRHFPECPLTRGVNVGNIRVEDDVEVAVAPPSRTFEPTTRTSHAGTLSELENYMKSATVRAVVEMGFSEENVKEVLLQYFNEYGKLFENSESLVERLLSLGIGQTLPVEAILPPLNTESVSPPVEVVLPTNTEAGSLAAEPQPRKEDETSNEENAANEIPKQGNDSAKRRRRRNKVKVRKKTDNSGASESSGANGASELSGTSGAVASASLGETFAAAGPDESNICGEEEGHGLNPDMEEQLMMEENSRLKEARTCKVCMDKEVNTVFLPCGHLVCCSVCSPKVRNCPVCRTYIRGTVKTYLT